MTAPPSVQIGSFMGRVAFGALAVLLALACALPARADDSPFLRQARALAGTDGHRMVVLARDTLTRVVQDGVLDPEIPTPAAGRTPAPFGVFVTLVKGTTVRGCYGSMDPVGKTLEELVVEAAVGAARFDPRSRPLGAAELGRVQVILSIVGPTVPVLTMSEVDPKREGLLVRSGSRSSVLLPGEARTSTWQLRRSLRQAGIRAGEPVEMFRFRTVTVYER